MWALYNLISLPVQLVVGIGRAFYDLGVNIFVGIRSLFGKTTKVDAAQKEKRSRKERKAKIKALRAEYKDDENKKRR